jgi:hypothetical protein
MNKILLFLAVLFGLHAVPAQSMEQAQKADLLAAFQNSSAGQLLNKYKAHIAVGLTFVCATAVYQHVRSTPSKLVADALPPAQPTPICPQLTADELVEQYKNDPTTQDSLMWLIERGKQCTGHHFNLGIYHKGNHVGVVKLNSGDFQITYTYYGIDGTMESFFVREQNGKLIPVSPDELVEQE